MTEHQHDQTSFLVSPHQPLIGLTFRRGDEDVVRYFADEDVADRAVPHAADEDALQLAGAWSDLDWKELQEGLDRIRHESPPSEPISL